LDIAVKAVFYWLMDIRIVVVVSDFYSILFVLDVRDGVSDING